MPAPGWYPDPDGSPRLRYFDGRQWTPNTAPLPVSPGTQGHQGGFQQTQNHPGGPPPQPTGGRNLVLWVVFGVVVAMILGVGTWLVFRNVAPPTPPSTPAPSVAQPSDPGNEPSVGDPSPPPESASPPEEPVALPQPGTTIEALAGCPATASDAVGEADAQGRYTSAAGLSMPAADGFVALPVPIPWLHGSNSQAKQYPESSWMSSFTVGEARAEDGFTDTTTTAVAMVACMLGSDFYSSVSPAATVTGSARAPEGDGVKLTVDVAVTGVADVAVDAVYVLVVKDVGVMHVLIATVPDTDPAAAEALDVVNADLRVE